MSRDDHSKPRVAISSCIAGYLVRYDGEPKHFPELCHQLEQYVVLIPVCPEVEIGLSVPRPPVQLTGDPEQPRMTGRDDPAIDITDKMRRYCQDKSQHLDDISGYIFKSKSPSCGLRNIPVLNNHTIIDDNRRGLFAQTMVNTYPDLPVAEETDLVTEQQCSDFVAQVLHYYHKHSGK